MKPFKQMVGLDFETYSGTDLPKHGLDWYISNLVFRPLIACIHFDNAGVAEKQVFDFVADYEHARAMLIDMLEGSMIVAHNAGFEQAVLSWMDIHIPSERFIDSAVLARAAGAAGKLESAAPQLLGMDKVEAGFHLIKLFSIPGEYQAKQGHMAFDPKIVEDNPAEWQEFIDYCQMDADLSFELARALLSKVSLDELKYNAVTMDMNNVGWRVDLPLVFEMQRRYLDNVEAAVAQFREECDAPDLNLSSFPQLKEWCEVRGVSAKSFDEKAVERMLKSLHKRMNATPKPGYLQMVDYQQVVWLLETKQIMGGSSLKKLQTIIDTISDEGRLHNQYLHIGAGATFRTTGRGVQMQNLKRLNGEGDDVELLFEEDTEWDNSRLASNLRQVFTASHPAGRLIVGDFSSVESRGLAWQAGEDWKLAAYTNGQDLYKVQASKIFNVAYADVTKPQRQIGKVGELACGYGAGPEAVQAFAAKMGVSMTPTEAAKLVRDWRNANEGIVDYWYRLDAALYEAVEQYRVTNLYIPEGRVEIVPEHAPKSLQQQTGNPDLLSLRIHMIENRGKQLLTRVIHGTYPKGHNIMYWKPSQRKTGDLWSDRFIDRKTKQVRFYSVYGGKLSGLLTQSLCREIFFKCLYDVHEWTKDKRNVDLVGQFHDEIVLDWAPASGGHLGLFDVESKLHELMSRSPLRGFPLAAEIKSDYRYTK